MPDPTHTDVRAAREAWDAVLARLRGVILYDATTSAIAHMAARVFIEYEAEIARLKAELDEAAGAHVLLCPSYGLHKAMADSTDEEPGTILRVTDNPGLEYEMGTDKIWHLLSGDDHREICGDQET